MSKQGKVLILALLAFLIFFVGFKIYHSKDVQASTIKLVNKSNETYAYSGSKKLTGLQKINGNNYYFDSTTGVMKTGCYCFWMVERFISVHKRGKWFMDYKN
ncbi:hypothetical protein KF7HA_01196 [Lactococcus lactis]|nr:hypothetical protein [Lactococcus lactis]